MKFVIIRFKITPDQSNYLLKIPLIELFFYDVSSFAFLHSLLLNRETEFSYQFPGFIVFTV
jgi:hypothetical protein